MNDFFRHLRDYCKSLRKESFVGLRTALDINKEDIIIFEADFDKIDFSLNNNQKTKQLIIPTDKMFIEIPKWKIEDDKHLIVNIGGILLSEEYFEEIKYITVKTLWIHYNKQTGQSFLKPIPLMIKERIYNQGQNFSKKDILKSGSGWNNVIEQNLEIMHGIEDTLKKDLASIVQKIIIFILLKVEKKEYTSYKKWTPQGFLTKDIIYSHEVSKHKRHFWKDSGRFKIPLMEKSEWEEKGYGTDEIVFRDGEIRRDVPFKIIGNYLVGKEKEKKEDNRRIKIAKGRIWRCEEKIYLILKELFPDKIIRRHDRKTLKGLELDFNLPEFRLGIEYDGEQHFDRKLCEEVFKSDFDAQIRRDRKKDKQCQRKKITLIRIKYDEPLTKRHIKNKLSEFI